MSGIDDDDILLAKEVNDAQLQLIRRLEKSGSVIVQGPPGTGKTHTIGNLIGHLLAQGKSILVTAQTEKALKVLREKVPKPLQPLCVSMLGSDQDGRLQLESNIQSIEERRTTDTVGTLRARETDFKEKRRELRARLRDLEQQLQQCLEGEYREILVAGENMSPADAARRLASGREHHDWIPSPVLPGSELPLSSEELCRLYRLGTTFTAQEELDAMFVIPEPSTLPSVSAFRELVLEYTDLLTRDVSATSGWWSGNGGSSAVIQEIADILEAEFSSVLLKQVWAPYAIVAGMRGGVARNNWESLIAAIERAVAANYRYEQVLHHQPQLADSIPVVDQQRQLIEINQYLTDGGTIGVFNLNAQWKWRRLLTSASVAAGLPCQKEHFEALGCLAELKSARLALEIRWNSLIGERAGMSFGSLSGTPELICSALVPEIRCCLNWSESVWGPLALKLKSVGLRLDELIHAQGHDWSEVAAFRVIEKLALKLIPQLLSDEFSRRRLSECRQAFASLENLSARQDPNAPHQGCIGPLAAAATARDVDGYREALSYVERLHALAPTISDRKALLARLWPIAPVWAEKIWRREAPHDAGTVPGDVTAAWMWRQIEEMLSEREKANVEELQREIRETRDELRGVTLQLIEAKAWGAQLKRLQDQDSIRQALVGWVDTQKRLISTQKNAKRQELLSEGRRLMNRCSSAVPVWIMPIWRVVESFDLRTTRFDVVIIDEASQADFNALIPLYMGQQVVIVGDHEQVTPLGVGKDSSVLDNLRKSMLQGIPNSHLFDNLTSIYDIARQSFGTAIRLTEHFRCVPEIIAFSNQLSYEGKIEPLREANSTNLRPACIARRVHGIRENEVNHGEAENIVSTIQAMLQHPAYAGKSIGVISMKGSAQAALIDKMLRDGNRISESEYQNRRILTGDAKDFQGDERDVIFLSLVDGAKEDGLLYKMGDGAFEQIKKRYNVATSRARDVVQVARSSAVSRTASQQCVASDAMATKGNASSPENGWNVNGASGWSTGRPRPIAALSASEPAPERNTASATRSLAAPMSACPSARAPRSVATSAGASSAPLPSHCAALATSSGYVDAISTCESSESG